jgi:NAD(P)-dependent dehydrogenase (short-subunit alcohol dehydrogenase family)
LELLAMMPDASSPASYRWRIETMDVRDKVTIITGASAGIGLTTARRFAGEGAKLVLAARSTETLQQLAAELNHRGGEAVAVTADMRSRDDVVRMVEQAFQHYGRIDILINNAGQGVGGAVADVSEDYFRQVIDLNVFGPLYAMQAVIPKMREGGGGVIVNVSSMTSKMSIPGIGAYASTKAALNVLSATARVELAPDNIRVIVIYPRLTTTDFGRNYLGRRPIRTDQPPASGSPPRDSPDTVAERILDAVRNEPAEQYMEA